MSQKFLLVWAITATALALVFLGYAIGKSAGGERQLLAPADYGPQQTDSTSDQPVMQPIDPYQVPPAFDGLPGEWRTPFDGRDFRGYAMLFDPVRRELIVEQCRHPGYFDERKGVAREGSWDFCTGVLWGTLLGIDEESATARDRSGQEVDIELSLNARADPPLLSLSFGDHKMTLEPGSKNDLLQAMDRSPQMTQQKDKLFKSIAAREDAQRRVAEESVDGRAAEVPTYSLPANAEERDEDASDRQ